MYAFVVGTSGPVSVGVAGLPWKSSKGGIGGENVFQGGRGDAFQTEDQENGAGDPLVGLKKKNYLMNQSRLTVNRIMYFFYWEKKKCIYNSQLNEETTTLLFQTSLNLF